ncbi:RtcB family protein, partial [bacterium]|nr:RtcB family protein [bacterium]
MNSEAIKKNISIHALNIDDITKKQFNDCISKDFVLKASLMPDAHSGYVAPIGSVIVTKDYIVPAWVGYDIGCGMIACKFKKNNILEEIKKYAKEIFDTILIEIPMGNGIINENKKISEKTKIEFKKILNNLENKKKDPEIFKFLKTQALSHLGSLGSGNHFIEIAYDDTNKNSDEIYLIIHSGSRGVGHKIASKYMKKAARDNINYEETYPLNIKSIEGEEYLNILNFALDFALLNRLEMAYKIRDSLREILKDTSLDFSLWVNKNHNHAIIEDDLIIHRKGATPAKKGEKGV